MKNRIIVSIIYIVLGILLALVPTVLFPTCDATEMKMACYYTKQAEVGLGVLVAVLGIVALLSKNADVRSGLSLAILGIAVLVVVYPLYLTGLCKMSDMMCRLRTLPALILISVVIGVVAIINFLYLGKGK